MNDFPQHLLSYPIKHEEADRLAMATDLQIGCRADFNLFKQDPTESQNGFFPWKTFIQGMEVPKEQIQTMIQEYSTTLLKTRKAGAL